MKKATKEAMDKVHQIEEELCEAFPERQPLVRGMLTAAIAGEHGLMLGPPGSAKSLFARKFAECVAGGSFFENLLTKFTTMEELFGPVSFKALKEDRYERILDGHACSRRVWFMDEIFKSSTAILNSFLTAMQERVFHNGGQPQDIPLEIMIGASNEYPQDESLAALYDRFSIKFWVDYIADDDALATLLERGGIVEPKTRLDSDDLAALRNAACHVVFTKSNVDTLLKIKAALTAEGFVISDRTWIKSTKMIKARAIVSGRGNVVTSDFMVLADMLWKEHKDRPRLKELIGNAADPYGSRAEAIVDGVKAAMGSLPSIDLLKSGQKSKVEMINDIGKISGAVSAERDKILDVQNEAGDDNEFISEAREIVEKAMEQVDELSKQVMWFRESGK
jgi:MoxR-like ATPase